MEKYLVNTYDNHWVECDSAEGAAQEVIENVDDYYWDDLLDDVYGEAEWLDKGNFCADFFASYDELWNRLFNPDFELLTIVERK